MLLSSTTLQKHRRIPIKNKIEIDIFEVTIRDDLTNIWNLPASGQDKKQITVFCDVWAHH